MKFKEGLLGFSSSSYCDKISAREYSYAELAKNIYKKRRAINVAKTSAVSSAAAAHVTGGTSLLGTLFLNRCVVAHGKDAAGQGGDKYVGFKAHYSVIAAADGIVKRK